MARAGDIIRAADISVQACKVSRSTNLTIPHSSSVETVVGFTTEDYDTDGMHDTVTNNTRITINTAGIYVVSFTGELAGATPTDYGRIYAAIRRNGTIIAISQENPIDAAGIMPQRLNVACTDSFQVGDYLEVYILQQNDSSAGRFLVPASDYSPKFAAARIGS